MWAYNYTYPDELYHHGVIGMKWGVHRASKRTYSGKEISDYRKRKMSEAPSKAESPRGANKGWYKNAPKSTLIRQMRQEDAKAAADAKKANKKPMSDKTKRALKIGAAVAGTALAAYGAKKIHDYVRSENSKIGEEAARKAMAEASNWSSVKGLYELATQDVRSGRYTEALDLEEKTAKIVADHALNKQRQIENLNFAKAAANVYLNRNK